MKRTTAILMGTVAVGSLCMGASVTSGSARADAPETKAQKPALPRIGWGEPQDGLQVGLFPESRQQTFGYGDTFALVMRVRNVSRALIAFTMKQPDVTHVTLGENGRLVLQTLGGGSIISFSIAPGETKDLPGGRYEAQLIAPGDELPRTDNVPVPALALLPGEYHAECSLPIWMPDKNDSSRATAHRAKPGEFTFTVREEGPRKPAPIKNEATSDGAILWGDPVNGLQGGIRRVTDKEFAALPEDKRKEIASDEILTRFYIRNTMDKPLRLSYQDFEEYDASFWVKDAQGKDQFVRSVFFTGLRMQQEQTLRPGEMTTAGWGRLKFQTQDVPREENNFNPMLTAKPGRYTLRLISSVRLAGLNTLDMVLVSKALPFVIPAQ